MSKTVRDVIYHEYAGHLLVDGKFVTDIENIDEVLNRFVVSDSIEIGDDGYLKRELRTLSSEEYEAIEKDYL